MHAFNGGRGDTSGRRAPSKGFTFKYKSNTAQAEQSKWFAVPDSRWQGWGWWQDCVVQSEEGCWSRVAGELLQQPGSRARLCYA